MKYSAKLGKFVYFDYWVNGNQREPYEPLVDTIRCTKLIYQSNIAVLTV